MEHDTLVWMNRKLDEAEEITADAFIEGVGTDDRRFDNVNFAVCQALTALQEAKRAIKKALRDLEVA